MSSKRKKRPPLALVGLRLALGAAACWIIGGWFADMIVGLIRGYASL